MIAKDKIWIFLCVLTGVFFIVNISCKKSEENDNSTPTDGDGNVYKTVTIGNQVWMAENLRTTSYNDGTAIPYFANNLANLNTPGYCLYNNDAGNKNIYGVLYNWHTINTGKLSPSGWHIPTNDDWKTLADFLGGFNVAGSKMKETGTSHWKGPNASSTNSSGFTALPGGYRDGEGPCFNLTNKATFWSLTQFNEVGAYFYYLEIGSDGFARDYDYKSYGRSVRCLRD